LDFQSHGTYWECRKKFFLVAGSVYHTANLVLDDVARNLKSCADEDWPRIVNEYTNRSLTKPSDKLPALSGVIAALQEKSDDTCHAAIWERHFVRLLLWQVAKDSSDRARAKRPSEWRAPSWSFASIEGRVEYSEESRHRYCPRGKDFFAKLEECRVVPVNLNNPLGELKSVSIVVKHVHIQYPHADDIRATRV
jgi:hypothetical protein